ncbi:peptidase M15 [Bacillus thuringiensis]|nr:M15 family metallopeptidase [Bacillus thuringiensis]PFN53279.1 peptidase M15 [Bacillus thuringiensis]
MLPRFLAFVSDVNLIGLRVNYEKLAITGFFDKKTNKYTKIFQDKTKLKPNGIFVFSTTEATKEYQKEQNLYPSGNITLRTRHKLFNPNSQSEFYASTNHLQSLYPYIDMLAKEFLQLTKTNGLDVRIDSVFWNWSEQDWLFSLGRWKPGKRFTNARDRESYHNWGLAFDAAPYENNSIPWGDIKKFKQMSYIGEQLGLNWGGRFTNLVDYPHFEYSFRLST